MDKLIKEHNDKNPNNKIDYIHFIIKVLFNINGGDKKGVKFPLTKISAGVHIPPENVSITIPMNLNGDDLEYVVLDE